MQGGEQRPSCPQQQASVDQATLVYPQEDVHMSISTQLWI